MPMNKAVELLLGGGVIAADEARRLGLINNIYPAATFGPDCAAFARQFLSLSRVALLYTKRAIREASGRQFLDALGHVEQLYLKDLMATSRMRSRASTPYGEAQPRVDEQIAREG